MLNGIVGYQLLDDGTPLSIGLMIASAALLFIGTGYVALDTGFKWTGYWDSTLTGDNQAYALYTLYQLVPLVFLVVFFLLEAYLVLRILGERKPLSKSRVAVFLISPILTKSSLFGSRRSPICHWTNFAIYCQRPHLQRHRWEDQRRSVRDPVHLALCCNDMGVLVEHYRRRLADARGPRIRCISVEGFAYMCWM